MPFQIKETPLGSMSVVRAVSQTLRRIDPRLIDHGERVAFIANEMREEGNLPLDEKTLFLLCIFHDIGAYKTDEIDRMVEFETHDVSSHATYGYLFLKHLSPLGNAAEAILYHHTPWNELARSRSSFADYAALIHLADRVDVLSHHETASEAKKRLGNASPDLFRSDYIKVLTTCMEKRDLFKRLANESFRAANLQRVEAFSLDTNEALEYLKMIVYSIDFRSECTVTHSINTASISLELARFCDFTQAGLEEVFLGAMLHDVGKIAIPPAILEKPGRLTDEEMEIMKTHVSETEQLIVGVLPDTIAHIASRHHEKLDGSGYPHGLVGSELSTAERIVAIADIASALCSARSYKAAFPREKTIAVLSEMSGTKLDERLCTCLCDNFDDIMEATESARTSVIETYRCIEHEFAELQSANTVF